jgi:uncharacterized protein GlcG (DUF336 family)
VTNDPVVVRKSITLEAAQLVINAAVAKAKELGKEVGMAVLDESGHLVSFARMDGAPYSTIQVGTDKAFTAAQTRKATADWFKTVQDDEPLRAGATAAHERLVVFGGGQVITYDGEVIGAIGVSGSHWSNDQVIGSAGIAALGPRAGSLRVDEPEGDAK